MELLVQLAPPDIRVDYYDDEAALEAAVLDGGSVGARPHTQCTPYTVHNPPRCTADSAHRVWHRW